MKASNLVQKLEWFFSTAAIVAAVLFFNSAVYAQQPEFLWAKQAGGTEDDYGYDIATDGFGNNYVTGFFKGTATFGPYKQTAIGHSDMFIAKYDPLGNVLWARQTKATNHASGLGITADGLGNTYVTGAFSGTATFGQYELTSGSMFIAKYDPAGTALWVTASDRSSGRSVAIDASGNSYVVGSFTVDYITMDVFIAKYDPRGNMLWDSTVEGTSTTEAAGISTDGSGNSYITGTFVDTVTFGQVTLTSHNKGENDFFIAKYDPSGTLLWVKQVWGTGSVRGNALVTDGSGNSYVTGLYVDTATFGEYILTSSSPFRVNVFIAKYNPLGSVLWAKGPNGSENSRGKGVALDESGNSYVTGTFSKTVIFGLDTLISTGHLDIYIAKYDPSGNVLWAKAAGGIDDDRSFGIATDGFESCIITGYFSGYAVFDSTAFTSAGGKDIFIAKLSGTSSNIKVIHPNGGEVWNIGEEYHITWNSSVTSGNVKIELSRNGGTTWEMLFASTSDDFSQPWITTGPSSDNCKIKITDLNDENISDVTDAPFSIAGSKWTEQNSGTSARLFGVKVVSDNIAWAVGRDETVLRTTNGGETWINVWQGPGTANFQSMDAIDDNTAFVTGWIGDYNQGTNIGIIYKTTNGGNSWTKVHEHSNAWVNHVKMFDQLNGIALGDPFNGIWKIIKTSDGGNSWQQISNAPTGEEGTWSSAPAVFWLDNLKGWFGTNTSNYYFTVDGGTSWSQASIPPLQQTNSLAFNQVGVGMAEYYEGQLVRTFDDGVNWVAISPPGAGTIRFLLFYQNKFWLLRDNSIYNSKDNGATWELQTISNNNLRHLSFATNQQSTYGWAVGDNGAILKYKNEATQGPSIAPVVSAISGDSITVDILVTDVTGLYGLSFDFVYIDNSGTITALSAAADPFFGSDIIFLPNINTTTKTVGVGLSRKPGQGSIDGTGNVARVYLKGYQSAPMGTSVSFELQNVTANDANGNSITFTVESSDPLITDVDADLEINTALPESFILSQNYPNPFNPETTIEFSLPKETEVTIKIINLLGKDVKTLVKGKQLVGRHRIVWDGTDNHGQRVASGVYLYRLQTKQFVQVKKLALLR